MWLVNGTPFLLFAASVPSISDFNNHIDLKYLCIHVIQNINYERYKGNVYITDIEWIIPKTSNRSWLQLQVHNLKPFFSLSLHETFVYRMHVPKKEVACRKHWVVLPQRRKSDCTGLLTCITLSLLEQERAFREHWIQMRLHTPPR